MVSVLIPSSASAPPIAARGVLGPRGEEFGDSVVIEPRVALSVAEGLLAGRSSPKGSDDVEKGSAAMRLVPGLGLAPVPALPADAGRSFLEVAGGWENADSSGSSADDAGRSRRTEVPRFTLFKPVLTREGMSVGLSSSRLVVGPGFVGGELAGGELVGKAKESLSLCLTGVVGRVLRGLSVGWKVSWSSLRSGCG